MPAIDPISAAITGGAGLLSGILNKPKKQAMPAVLPGPLADLSGMTYEQWISSLPSKQQKTARATVPKELFAEFQRQSQIANSSVNFNEGLVNGTNPNLSPDWIRLKAGPVIARTEADTEAMRQAIANRAISNGLGSRSGVVGAQQDAANRAQLGANRQTMADLLSQSMERSLQYGSMGAQQLSNMAFQNADLANQGVNNAYKVYAYNKSLPSTLQSALGGLAGAFAGQMPTYQQAPSLSAPTSMPLTSSLPSASNWNWSVPSSVTPINPSTSPTGSFQLPPPTSSVKMGSGPTSSYISSLIGGGASR